MNNFRAKVITTPTSKREHGGSEVKRFCGVSEDNKITQFTARANQLTNVSKNNYIVVSNAKVTAHGNKLSVNVGPTSKVLHVVFLTATLLPFFAQNLCTLLQFCHIHYTSRKTSDFWVLYSYQYPSRWLLVMYWFSWESGTWYPVRVLWRVNDRPGKLDKA